MTTELPELPDRSFDDYPSLPFDLIREKLDDILTAMYNLLDREWPERYASRPELRTMLMAMVKIAENTYQSVRFLCADRPENPARKLEFAVSVPPLTRTILDSVYTLIYLFDDVESRLDCFHQSGWREVYEEHQRYRERYGEEKSWAEYLGWQQAFVDHARENWGIREEQAANPRSIRWWKNPGRMVGDETLSAEDRRYLRYLNDWYYKQLSADSHLSLPGLMRRAGHLLQPDKEKRLNLLRKYKSDCVVTTIALVLSLLSELEIEFAFGRNTRLKEVWATLAEVSLEVRELYDFRYTSRL